MVNSSPNSREVATYHAESGLENTLAGSAELPLAEPRPHNANTKSPLRRWLFRGPSYGLELIGQHMGDVLETQ